MKKLYNYRQFAKIIVITCAFTSFITAADNNKLDNQQLIQQAEQFIIDQLGQNNSSQLEVEASPLDERITVPPCPQDIQYSVSPDALYQSNIAVKAQCEASDWYIYIMVRATEIQPVVVVNQAISPGTLLNKSNLQVINMDKKRLRTSTFADIDSVIGAKVRRRLIAGRPVEPQDLCFVCKGDKIVISAQSRSMQVKTNGVALEDGNIGETIRVQNSRSNKNLMAQIVNSNEVKVNL